MNFEDPGSLETTPWIVSNFIRSILRRIVNIARGYVGKGLNLSSRPAKRLITLPDILPHESGSSGAEERSPWTRVKESTLRQGDHLLHCYVPIFGPDFEPGQDHQVQVKVYELIVVTQSCDLDRNPSADRMVAVCPRWTLPAFEEINPGFKKRGEWEEVRKGRRNGLYLLPCPEDPMNSRGALVVDFREIYSLAFGYLQKRAIEMGLRWRLQSPYTEAFSHAFGAYFTRVALPTAIPPFK